jgi:hypothetical protein
LNSRLLAFFLKQFGSVAIYRGQSFPTEQYAGADSEEWPPRLRIREDLE